MKREYKTAQSSRNSITSRMKIHCKLNCNPLTGRFSRDVKSTGIIQGDKDFQKKVGFIRRLTKRANLNTLDTK
jgi:hypothetical protein